jgi:CPA2 family monovalent cation:H+ antiporter-2
MPAERLFLDLVVIMAAAALIAVVARRLRLALIPGYLVVGALVGPHALGFVGHPETAEAVSHLAVILLMFTIGLHMDVGGMRRLIGPVLACGLGAALVVTALGWPVGAIFGLSPPAAIAVGGALAMSSTAVVVKTIQERRDLHRPYGRIVFGALLVQDLLAVALLGGVSLLAAWAGLDEAAPGAVALRLLAGIAGVALMLLIGRALLPRLLEAAARTASGEVLIVVSAAVALCAAATSTYLGFSAELGAFLAGFLLASTPFRFQIAGQLMPMRDLFMAVFFTTVGLELDLLMVVQGWSIVLPALAALLAIKALVNATAAWLAGTPGPTAVLTGIALANAGEFSIVLLAAAGAAGVVSPTTEAQVIGVIVCALILTPSMITLAPRVAARFAGIGPSRLFGRLGSAGGMHLEESGDESAPPPHVIIAGYGVVGRAVADRFARACIPFCVIEMNPETVRKQSRLGRSIIYGDVSNPAVLESAGVARAVAVVLTIPDHEALFRACPLIRSLAPGAIIAARTSYLSQAMVLHTLGADLVTIEEVATAEAMASQVLARLDGLIPAADPPVEPGADTDKAVGPA